MRTAIKVLAALAAVGVLGVLFVRSAKNVAAEPYTVAGDQLRGWVPALDPSPNTSGIVLALVPPPGFSGPLFNQLFARTGLSLRGPSPVSMPLILTREFDQGMAQALPPDALIRLAQTSGVGAEAPRPVCMASRRVSQPGSTRDVFFMRLDLPALEAFRRQVAQQLGSTSFDPAGLSPVVILAGTDDGFSSWLPLRPDGTSDCTAPVTVQ